MRININVKGVSNRKEKIKQITYEYQDKRMTLQEFLSETVRKTVRDYNFVMESKVKGKANSDYYDRSEDYMEVMKCFSRQDIDDAAISGRIGFGVMYGDKMASEEAAVENAVQCFKDGMIAVFIGGTRYEDLNEELQLFDGSEVTFVRLTFLVGRMW